MANLLSRSPTILLIDDSASVHEVLGLALESEGYRVIEAGDGREGVRLFREHRPAVVLVDIVIPEKNGDKILRTDEHPGQGSCCSE